MGYVPINTWVLFEAGVKAGQSELAMIMMIVMIVVSVSIFGLMFWDVQREVTQQRLAILNCQQIGFDLIDTTHPLPGYDLCVTVENGTRIERYIRRNWTCSFWECPDALKDWTHWGER